MGCSSRTRVSEALALGARLKEKRMRKSSVTKINNNLMFYLRKSNGQTAAQRLLAYFSK